MADTESPQTLKLVWVGLGDSVQCDLGRAENPGHSSFLASNNKHDSELFHLTHEVSYVLEIYIQQA